MLCFPAGKAAGNQAPSKRARAHQTCYHPPPPPHSCHTLRAAPRKRCYKRKCGAPRRGARFPDKPAFRVPGVTTYGGCCKLCRTATGCLRFHVGPSGCSIYRTRPQAPTMRSKRFTASYREWAGVGLLTGQVPERSAALVFVTLSVAALVPPPCRCAVFLDTGGKQDGSAADFSMHCLHRMVAFQRHPPRAQQLRQPSATLPPPAANRGIVFSAA